MLLVNCSYLYIVIILVIHFDSRFKNFIHTVYMQWMYIGKKYE